MRLNSTDRSYGQREPLRLVLGIALVLAARGLIAFALLSGGAGRVPEPGKKPLEAVVIQEVTVAPPSPAAAAPQQAKVQPQPQPQPRQVVKSPPTRDSAKPNLPAPFAPVPDFVAAAGRAADPPAAAQAPPDSAPVAPPASASVKVLATAGGSDIGLVCAGQVKPKMPRRAQQLGLQGVVKAQAVVKDGVVRDVVILSGPEVFHAAVRAAMLQYKCTQEPIEVTAVQAFNFKVE